MRQALRLAALGLYSTYPNPAVGCVFVRDGRVIGSGYHVAAGGPHAEIVALESAHGDVRGATCYVSLEPCSHYGRTPPCAERLVREGIKRCVVACVDPNPKVRGQGIAMLERAGVEVLVGVLADKARYLNRAFFKSIVTGVPYVTVKVGMSLDARTALVDGSSKWITSPRSRSHVQKLRARCDAIITGSGTVSADDPRLDVRYEELPPKVRARIPRERIRSPLKVVLDSRARLDPGRYRLFSTGQVIWCTGEVEGFHGEERLSEHVLRVGIPLNEAGHIPFTAVLERLGGMGIRHALVEAGGGLTGSLIDSGLADELVVFAAPKILGPDTRPAFRTCNCTSMAKAIGYRLRKVREIGDDVKLVYELTRD